MENEAKIKALELMQRFNEPTMQWDELDGFIANKYAAKTCALILCDELIEFEKQIILQLEKDAHLKGGVLIVKNLLWEQVKQEIEKL
jgi:hypothetical protein